MRLGAAKRLLFVAAAEEADDGLQQVKVLKFTRVQLLLKVLFSACSQDSGCPLLPYL